MFRKMPFILLCIVALVLLLNPFIPLQAKEILYAISLMVKSLIVFLLPFIIFSLLFKTMIGLARQATLVIALILLCVCVSNFLSTFLSHYMGAWVYHFDMALIQPKGNQTLLPAWSWELPKLIANDKAMFLGIILGIIFGSLRIAAVNRLTVKLELVVAKILESFTYLIPLFIVGFVVKLQFDGVVHTIIKDYTAIFMLIALALYGYIFFVYAVLNHFQPTAFLRCIKNILPAAVAGFSTMSSAAVMPLTMLGAERNANNKDLARSIIPATVNIHLMGDCFAIPIFAYAVMKSFGIAEPALMSYLIFIFYFVMAKFSVAAIPGGGIIVMLPILESCFGFNAEMLSLITALYILFDPVITCANVLGNGAFAKWVDGLMARKEKIAITN